jgi:hypothetical protein
MNANVSEKGLIMSDWGGCNLTVESINTELNLEMLD